MEQLIQEMKVTLATAFSLYLKSHNYHWNVTGPDFAQYHSFLGQFYEDVHDSVDFYAEHIRTLNSFSPGSLARYLELTLIEDEVNVPSGIKMLERLYLDNEIFKNQLYRTVQLAENSGRRGIVNFLEDRIDFHDKMSWMLKSFQTS